MSRIPASCGVRLAFLVLQEMQEQTMFSQVVGPPRSRGITWSRFRSFRSNTCQYCGDVFERNDLNLDHVIPRDRGGPTTWENIVCSCISCNTKKANRTPQEAGMRLIRKPKRPKWRPFVQINLGLHYHDSWKHFLDLAYWNVELGENLQ